MSTVPPPPGSRPNVGSGPVPVPGKSGVNPGRKRFAPEDYEYPSKLPIVLSLLALIFSLAISLFTDNVWLDFVGYFLTPILAISLMGVDSFWQRIRSSREPYFIAKSSHFKILRLLAVIGVLLALPHVNALANSISAWIAQILGIN
ncbi:MAG: hypothetical protein ACO319_05365 [Candidatus Nanopelagicaceae bacterium]